MPSFSVLVLKADTYATVALQSQVLAAHPGARCLMAHRIGAAREILARHDVDLFLTGIGLPDGDVLDLLLQRAEAPRAQATLVVTHHREPRLIASLRRLNVAGLFDTGAEPLDRLAEALTRIARGGAYWSESLHRQPAAPQARALLCQLTPTEQLAFALVADGCADKVAAERLGMTVSATRAVRRDLHAKLGAHDRSDLIQLAVRHGYIRFTAEGAFPVGLGMLRREYLAYRKRSVDRRRQPTGLPATGAGQ